MIYIILPVILILILIFWAERGMVKPSSVTMARKQGFGLKFIYFYCYARWTSIYLRLVRLLMPSVVKFQNPSTMGDSYHGKVLTPEQAKKIITIEQSIPLQDLEQIIPYPTARQLVLDHPLDIVVMECPCRKASAHPCSPSMVCMIIGKPFTDFIMEHHPKSSKRLTTMEALDLLEEVHRQGCVHTAYFKDVCLDRFYVICNCCKCCCMGIEAMTQFGVNSISASGYLARMKEEACIKCGSCVKACPFEAIDSSCQIDFEKCMGCGVCVEKCKQGAISLVRDQKNGIPLDIRELKQ